MTFGEKLSKLRKENNYTQEQLADILGVSRQSVSKWESDIVFPETEKLIKIGKIFDCSMDYLLKDDITDKKGSDTTQNEQIFEKINRYLKNLCRERKSKITVCGMPLYHIAFDARGFFAIGVKSKGIFSIGLRSFGIFSLGILSLGIVSFGLLTLGLIALGVFALGLLSVGAVAVGLFAVGAVSVGIVSFGALSVGCFSVGAAAFGKYVAFGDHAKAMIAVGDTDAVGSIFEKIGELSTTELDGIKEWLDINVPALLSWAKNIFKFYIS